MSNPSINIITLGCSKNIADSEKLAALLSENNFNVKHNSKDFHGDIVILNTCGFVNDARQESIDNIFYLIEQKHKGSINKILVVGCFSQRYRDDLEKEIKEIDGYFGTEDYENIIKYLRPDVACNISTENRILLTPSHYAYLKISEGCNHNCSFCAIPIIRGKHRSKPIELILSEARMLATKGVKEINIIAEDSTYYGMDIYNKRSLSYLLEKISEVEGIEWIRLLYAYPAEFPYDVIQTIKNNSKVCKYIDIPIQHINDAVLKSMKRGITKEKTIKLINDFRDAIPDIALRTSIIVGYPGETIKVFSELLSFIEVTKFDRLGVFIYSKEGNTPAFNFKDNVTLNTKLKRQELIMQLQQNISLNNNLNKVGNTYKVLIDDLKDNYFIGRTEFDAPDIDNNVIINATDNEQLAMEVGAFYNLKIKSASEYDLYV